MADINVSIRKLINALNHNGYRLLYSKKQFYDIKGKLHSYYIISSAHFDKEKNRFVSTDIYGSSSTVRIVLYLRDMWFQVNGWELPTDNDIWNRIRKEIAEKNETKP